METLDASNASTVDYGAVCAICQSSDHRTAAEVATPECCDHRFCFSCLMRWSSRINTCPVCRLAYQLILVLNARGTDVARTIRVADRTRVNISLQDAIEDGFEELAGDSLRDVNCEVCGCGDAEACLLLCDGCERGTHTFCLNPPLDSVPPGAWYCNTCQRDRGDTRQRPRPGHRAPSGSVSDSGSDIDAEEVEELVRDAGLSNWDNEEESSRRNQHQNDRRSSSAIYSLRENVTARQRQRQREANRRSSSRLASQLPSTVTQHVRRELRARRRRSEMLSNESFTVRGDECRVDDGEATVTSHDGFTMARNTDIRSSEIINSQESADDQDEARSLNVSTIGESFDAVTDSDCDSETNSTLLVGKVQAQQSQSSVCELLDKTLRNISLGPIETPCDDEDTMTKIGEPKAKRLRAYRASQSDSDCSNASSVQSHSLMNEGFCESAVNCYRSSLDSLTNANEASTTGRSDIECKTSVGLKRRFEDFPTSSSSVLQSGASKPARVSSRRQSLKAKPKGGRIGSDSGDLALGKR